jgi:hypothetical protein
MMGVFCIGFAMKAAAYNKDFRPPPADKNVTIANGGLSVTFNTAWGAAVIGIADERVDHGLNLVDKSDVGRELQPCHFLMVTAGGREQIFLNPTQAGAAGRTPFFRHPKGVVIPEKGSPVVRWKADREHFHAVIKPLDYDNGNPSNWVYVEDARIDSQGVAHFRYVFYDHEPRAYDMIAILPTLYSDRTGTFMYPLVSPYGQAGAALRNEPNPSWPVKVITGTPAWPQKPFKSEGWIANIDATDNLGIFYTTPVGLSGHYGSYGDASQYTGVSDRPPLGQTDVEAHRTAYPGEISSLEFSVLVSTPQRGPALISKQPAALFKVLRRSRTAAVTQSRP